MRLLAVRDEDPQRAWDAPGPWWPETYPGVVGVRDRQAGGAWLATDAAAGRFSVILNRFDPNPPAPPPGGFASRGGVVLSNAAGAPVDADPGTASFNLVTVSPEGVTVTFWVRGHLDHQHLEPGLHMLAHHGVNDTENTARIAEWLPRFRELAGITEDWQSQWISALTETTRVAADDDRAILRDNRPYGVPTQSLLACIADIYQDSVRLDTAVLDEPAAPGAEPRLRFERSI